MISKITANKRWFLYVIKLKKSKWYIGITTKTPEQRFIEHRNNVRAAAWTRKYKPIELFDSRDLGIVTEVRAKTAENRTVREYMKKYGLNNVRGGDLSEIQAYRTFLNRIFPQSQWEWVRVTLVFIIMCASFLGMYIYEHFIK